MGLLKCAFRYRVLHGMEIVRNCYAWDADARKQINTNQQNFQNCFSFSDVKTVQFGQNSTDRFWITFVFLDGSADSLEVRKDKNIIRYNRREKDGNWYTVFEK